MGKLVRKKWENGVEYCYCKDEKVFHPCTHFTIDNSTPHGRNGRCRECNKIHVKKLRAAREGADYNLDNKTIAYNLLERIGYDTTQNIHKQFLQKFNL